MSRKRCFGDEEIVFALHDGVESEDGLDYDDDSLADPDFIPELDTLQDETSEVDIDVDSLIEILEEHPEGSSSNMENVSSNQSSVHLAPTQSKQTKTANEKPTKKKPAKLNFKLYFDNYFTSLRLLEYLAKEGILSLGTVRRNRLPDCKLSSEKDIMKKERGYSEEYVADVNGVDVSTVAWKDNKIVNLACTFAGQKPETDVRRWDKQNSRYIMIKRPNVVGEYNRHMGGIDLLDSIMGIYKIRLRSKRWHMRLFYHYLDLTMANAWLLYKRVAKYKNFPESGRLASADFRLEVAVTLCKLGIKPSVSGRRSLEDEIQAKKHKGPAQHVPPKAVRQDQIGHWPQWSEKKIRCKFPKCTGFTHNVCEKCGVALCYTKNKNCFRNFHLS